MREFDGLRPLAMTGGTVAHDVIRMNLVRTLGNRLAGSPCRVHGSSLKIQVAGSIRYRDAFVSCAPLRRDATVIDDPMVIFEIISDSTARTDRIVKNREYAATPSVRRYVLLEQDAIEGTLFARAETGEWLGHLLGPDAVLHMPEIGVDLPLATTDSMSRRRMRTRRPCSATPAPDSGSTGALESGPVKGSAGEDGRDKRLRKPAGTGLATRRDTPMLTGCLPLTISASRPCVRLSTRTASWPPPSSCGAGFRGSAISRGRAILCALWSLGSRPRTETPPVPADAPANDRGPRGARRHQPIRGWRRPSRDEAMAERRFWMRHWGCACAASRRP